MQLHDIQFALTTDRHPDYIYITFRAAPIQELDHIRSRPSDWLVTAHDSNNQQTYDRINTPPTPAIAEHYATLFVTKHS